MYFKLNITNKIVGVGDKGEWDLWPTMASKKSTERTVMTRLHGLYPVEPTIHCGRLEINRKVNCKLWSKVSCNRQQWGLGVVLSKPGGQGGSWRRQHFHRDMKNGKVLARKGTLGGRNLKMQVWSRRELDLSEDLTHEIRAAGPKWGMVVGQKGRKAGRNQGIISSGDLILRAMWSYWCVLNVGVARLQLCFWKITMVGQEKTIEASGCNISWR